MKNAALTTSNATAAPVIRLVSAPPAVTEAIAGLVGARLLVTTTVVSTTGCEDGGSVFGTLLVAVADGVTAGCDDAGGAGAGAGCDCAVGTVDIEGTTTDADPVA